MVGLSNVDNTADASKPISTLQQAGIDLKANLSGATLTGTINTNSNIVFTGTGKIKYPSGTSGQVLTSDSTGLLSLATPSGGGGASLSYVNGTLGGALTSTQYNQVTNFSTLTLTAGTWIISYRVGMFILTGSGTINWMELYMNTTSGTSSLTTNGYCNDSGAFTVSGSQQYSKMSGSYIVTPTATTNYYINQIINWTGTMTIGKGNTGLSYAYAVKIA